MLQKQEYRDEYGICTKIYDWFNRLKDGRLFTDRYLKMLTTHKIKILKKCVKYWSSIK